MKISPNSANENEELIFYNSYDNLGQLQEKKVGGSIGTNYETSKGLQTINYDYNVRGWLKGINKDSSEADLFHFGLYYNTALNGSTPLYNGNIAATQWQTENEDKALKSYHYSYDALNRITKATDNTNKYSVSNIAYDKNGNITTLQRAGRVAEFPNLAANTGFGVMDDLSYSYESNTNKLAKVTDNAALDHYGFKDDAVNQATDYSADYAYDANGNMTSDTNKGITKIAYNHLNLPKEITIANGADTGTITYTYDAVGTKLDKKVSKNNSTSTTAYAGNYIYENNKLQFFNTPEGYAKPKSTANYAQGFTYVYQYKDHLGNVRLSYADTDKNYENVVRNSFTEDYKSWTNNGSVQLSIDTGRLKVVVDNEYEGVKNFMNGFTTTAGETLKINLTIDTGTTQSALRLYLQELDPNGNLVNYNLLNGNLTTGKHQYQHITPTTGNRLVLRIDKTNTNKTASTYFYIDQIALSRGALEIVEEKNYYPFGLEHKGYNNVVNGTENNYKTFQGQEINNELGLNWLSFKYRNYDPTIGRFMSIDPLAEDFVYNGTYNFAENKVISHLELEGLEGIHSSKVDGAGIRTHVIQKNVVVLTQSPRPINAGSSPKRAARIQRQNARIAQSNVAKVNNVRSELKSFFSGAKNSAGESVDFQFNVTAMETANTKGGSTRDVVGIALANGEESGEVPFAGAANSIAPAAVVTTDGSGSASGLTEGNVKISTNLSDSGVLSHEVGHTLMTGVKKEDDYPGGNGGLMDSPPQRVNFKEVDRIINNSYERKN